VTAAASPLPWSGCHGVRLGPPDRGAPYGTCAGTPLLEAELALGPITVPGGRELWAISTNVDVGGEAVAVDQRLVRDAQGTDVLVGATPLLSVDHRRSLITTGTAEDDPRTLQMVTTFAIPLLLHDAGVLVFHASACARDGMAVVVAGRSGSGKSSLLVALLEAGWQTVSEDLCAVELRGDGAWVWPGPPWVRRVPGAAGPEGSRIRFEARDKTAWDLSEHMVDGPRPVAAMVLLDAPGGSAVQCTPMDAAEAIGHLAHHAVWLGDPLARAAALFKPCAQLARAVPARGLRIPRQPAWGDAVRALDEALSAAATTSG
jgi:hypothetical protein